MLKGTAAQPMPSRPMVAPQRAHDPPLRGGPDSPLSRAGHRESLGERSRRHPAQAPPGRQPRLPARTRVDCLPAPVGGRSPKSRGRKRSSPEQARDRVLPNETKREPRKQEQSWEVRDGIHRRKSRGAPEQGRFAASRPPAQPRAREAAPAAQSNSLPDRLQNDPRDPRQAVLKTAPSRERPYGRSTGIEPR
jgi:hypothetical protein